MNVRIGLHIYGSKDKKEDNGNSATIDRESVVLITLHKCTLNLNQTFRLNSGLFQ